MKTLVRPLAVLLLAFPLARLSADVHEDWATHCALCHGRDGAAKSRAARLSGAKDLTDAAYQKTFTDQAAFNDLKNGLVRDGRNQMKPFKDELSDDQIKALVAYVRSLEK